MDSNTKYFITLLSSFINKQKPIPEQNIDWKQVYKLGKIHSVSGMVYLMAKELEQENKPSPEILRQLKKDFISTAMLSATQESEMNTIIETLNEAKIPHVLMKGYVLKNYYPAKEMRTMGDIDILIKPEDREKSHKLFQELGYAPTDPYGEVWVYAKGTVYLEIHTKIMCRNMHNRIDYIGYFSNAWNNIVQTQKAYTFEFENTYHFLYLMVHIAKHFDGSGCGIRMIMDIAVYLQYFKGSLDWSSINEEIKKLNLEIFSKNIYILCNHWFNTNFDFNLPYMEESFYDELSQYILSAGTFGFYQRNRHTRSLRNEYLESKVAGKKLTLKVAMINAYRKKLFPDYKTACADKYSSFIKNRPLLLPVGWICRFIGYALEKPKESFRLLVGIAKGRKEYRKQFEVISKLGL
jgi:hypothetical protein